MFNYTEINANRKSHELLAYIIILICCVSTQTYFTQISITVFRCGPNLLKIHNLLASVSAWTQLAQHNQSLLTNAYKD